MKYAPTVLMVHPMSAIATLLAQIFRENGFHVLALSDAVDALEHVENLLFDVAVVSDEMPSALPELLFQSYRQNWIEVLIFKTPEEWELADFMLTISEAAKNSAMKSCMVEAAWHDGWYGEAGYEYGSSGTANLTEAELEAEIEELQRRLAAAREHHTNVES